VSVAAIAAPAPRLPGADYRLGLLENRFHVVSVACQRVMQLRSGARPRLDPEGHKHCVVAVAEVVANAIPYYSSLTAR
jgi:DNA-directed RNA polymerase subunit K/omega